MESQTKFVSMIMNQSLPHTHTHTHKHTHTHTHTKERDTFPDQVYYISTRMKQENHFTLWRLNVNYTIIKIQFVPHREHSVYILKNKKISVV